MAARVVVVDDEGWLRTIVGDALQRHGGFTIVGEAEDGDGCVRVVTERQPDVVVLDLHIPGLAGADLVDRLREAAPGVRIVIYSARAADEVGAIGADDHVLKDGDLDVLVRTVERLTGSARSERVASAELPADTESPAVARRFVSERCIEWSCSAVVDSALLIVSELVTNAVIHAGSRCELSLSLTQQSLRIEVADGAAAGPAPGNADPDAESGRGLLLVDAMADAWGVESASPGKVVWAELVRPAGAHG